MSHTESKRVKYSHSGYHICRSHGGPDSAASEVWFLHIAWGIQHSWRFIITHCPESRLSYKTTYMEVAVARLQSAHRQHAMAITTHKECGKISLAQKFKLIFKMLTVGTFHNSSRVN